MIAPTLLFFLSLPLFGNCAAVTTVTLLELVPTTTDEFAPDFSDIPTPTPVYSAVGVGSDGLTTYIEAIEYSRVYAVDGFPTGTTTLSNGDIEELLSFSTSTATVPVQTQLATLLHGASQYKYVQEATALDMGGETNCHWDENGKGECEVKAWQLAEPTLGTITATYSGTVQPVYTLVVSDTIPGQPSASSAAPEQPSASAANTSFGLRQVEGVSTIVMIMSSAAFIVLSGLI